MRRRSRDVEAGPVDVVLELGDLVTVLAATLVRVLQGMVVGGEKGDVCERRSRCAVRSSARAARDDEVEAGQGPRHTVLLEELGSLGAEVDEPREVVERKVLRRRVVLAVTPETEALAQLARKALDDVLVLVVLLVRRVDNLEDGPLGKVEDRRRERVVRRVRERLGVDLDLALTLEVEGVVDEAPALVEGMLDRVLERVLYGEKVVDGELGKGRRRVLRRWGGEAVPGLEDEGRGCKGGCGQE